jgi:hypothetical protein
VAEVSVMSKPVFRDLMKVLGDVAASLQELSVRLRQRHDVTGVDRRCEISGGERPAVEWYVDAELASGDALSWRLLVHWADAEWVIEADVRRVSRSGSDAEVEFDNRTSDDAALRAELLAAAADLNSAVGHV